MGFVPCKFMKTMSLFMILLTFVENAAICSCMYMRKVSLDHLPIFRIVSRGIPWRCIAMAPPARREWVLTLPVEYPKDVSPRAATASLMALSMLQREAIHPGLDGLGK